MKIYKKNVSVINSIHYLPISHKHLICPPPPEFCITFVFHSGYYSYPKRN